MGILRRSFVRNGFTYRDVKNLRARTSPDYTAGGASAFSNTLSTQFDGVDEYVDYGNDASLQITNNLTVSFWTKYPSPAAGLGLMTKWNIAASGRSWIIHTNNGAGGTDKVLVLLSNDGNGVQKQYVSSVTVFDSSWHHFALTFNTNVLKFYVDGVEDTSVDKQVDGTVNSLFNASTNVLAGAYQSSGSPAGFYPGLSDEQSIWDTDLSAAGISEIYNSGTPTDLSQHSAVANLVSWWRMGDGDTHPTITDNQGSNDGTMVNMESGDFVSDVP